MDNKTQIFNIFPTTIYVGEVENHTENKKEFIVLEEEAEIVRNYMINLITRRMKYQLP